MKSIILADSILTTMTVYAIAGLIIGLAIWGFSALKNYIKKDDDES